MISNFYTRVFSILVFLPIVIFSILKDGYYFNILLFFLLVLCFYEIIKLEIFYTKVILFLLTILFVISAYNIRKLNYGINYIFLILLITSLSDIGGYIFGKLIGGKKINFISPNKTFSGFAGSLILSQLSLVYIYIQEFFIFDKLYKNVFFIFISSLIVILGDLIFSYIKRVNSIKDYSTIIPGHGGILDRIDGLILFTTLFYFAFLIL